MKFNDSNKRKTRKQREKWGKKKQQLKIYLAAGSKY